MKKFGGKTMFLDRSDINTDEIIPAKYLTENSKLSLGPHMLEDLKLKGFDPNSENAKSAGVVVTRANFGCGSSREHAVWVFEVNDINVVVAESFARIFRQNMFNYGMLAIELDKEEIEEIFQMKGATIDINLDTGWLTVKNNTKEISFEFALNEFDEELVRAGGWLQYADRRY